MAALLRAAGPERRLHPAERIRLPNRLPVVPNLDALPDRIATDLDPTGGCYVLRYHLTTKNLQRYALPAGYFYTAANFSPRGHYVLMSRVLKTDREEERVRQAYENAEIVLMKADGTDFKVLPL